MGYVVQRLLFSFLSLFILLLITFVLTHLTSADPAVVAAGPNAGAEKIAMLRQQMGLDQPLISQFFIYCSSILRGDFGISWFTRQPIVNDLMQELPPSLELVFVAMIINLVVSLPLGLVMARYNNTRFDDITRLIVTAGVGLPVFWVAIILQQVFGGTLQWLPVAGRLGFEHRNFAGATGFYLVDSLAQGRLDVFADTLAHLVLPAFSLALLFSAVATRITRTSMISEFRKDYVLLARAKGASEGRIMFRHVFPNGATPALTVFGMQFGWMLGTTVLVEEIFGRPGVGRYAVKAVTQSDIHAVVAVVFVIGFVFLFFNLLVDVVLYALSPLKQKRA